MPKEKLCEFTKVYQWIPSKRLIKLYYQPKKLSKKEYAFLLSELRKTEKNITKLLHVKSIVEKGLLKHI